MSQSMPSACRVKAVVFDYGGVLAEEGFREGLKAMARGQGLDPEAFFRQAEEVMYGLGYVVGRAGEGEWWRVLRERTGITGSDCELRDYILSRFILRAWMIEAVQALRQAGLTMAILSDQTNWLDELEARDRFFGLFHKVYNSYHLGRSKREPLIFAEIASSLGVAPGAILFVDDNEGHVQRAESMGLATIHFTDQSGFERDLAHICPGLNLKPNTESA